MYMEPADTFSTRLEVCYEVLLFLASRMQKLAAGQILEFISCDPDAEPEISAWVALHNYELVQIEPLADGQTRFLIRR